MPPLAAVDPALVARGADRVLLCADMHLGEHDPATAERFFRRLAGAVPGCTHLLILGDLFEVWVGDDQHDAISDRVGSTLRTIAEMGCRVFLMRGNRDFLLDAGPLVHARSFIGRCGAHLLADPCVADWFDQPVLLTHGDALCTGDLDYQAFRRVSRDPNWQASFLAAPLAERLAQARALRQRSAREKSSKPLALMDVNPDEVRAWMRSAGVTRLVHGHTHRPARHHFDLDGAQACRLVLPDWDAADDRGGFLLIDRDGARPA